MSLICLGERHLFQSQLATLLPQRSSIRRRCCQPDHCRKKRLEAARVQWQRPLGSAASAQHVEYNVLSVYHAVFAFVDLGNVTLEGLAKFFKQSSEEERDHAEKLMEYQNKRGGRVKLQSILMPLSEFDHSEKGEALHDIR